MDNKIALVGMMGSGKSEVGKRLANILGFTQVDLDEEFEKKYGSISNFFENKGEREFREKEKKLLEEFCKHENVVISTGGGIIEKAENREILKRMRTFYLENSPEELWERVKDSSRPLIKKGRAYFMSLHEKRKKLYDLFERIDVNKLLPYEVAAKLTNAIVADKMIEKMNTFQKVRIFHGPLPSNDGVVVSAKNVDRIWKTSGIVVDDGENLKSVGRMEKLWEIFLNSGISRSSRIRAVGGGTLTDAVGFASLTFMRGIPFELVPTTLLGMVDASIGGKFAINFKGTKNLVGAFGKPDVLVNPMFSLSLSDERFKEGIVESLKIGVVYDKRLFEYIEDNVKKILKKNLESVDEMVKLAVKDKLEVVRRDPFDKNFRHILNFGHTVAHAIESASQNTISHGHAVAIGMIMESQKFSPLIYERVKNIVEMLNFKEIEIPNFEKWFIMDKKREGSQIIIPIVKEIGKSHLKRVDINTVLDTFRNYP